MFTTKFLVFDTQFPVFDTKFLVFNTKFMVFTHWEQCYRAALQQVELTVAEAPLDILRQTVVELQDSSF